MRPSKYCKIIIRRHVVVVVDIADDNNYEVAQNDDAPSNSNSSNKNTTTVNNNHDHDSENDNNDDDHVYRHINSFPISTLATGFETWAHFSQRIFNDSVIEASNSSRLLPLLVHLHPNKQRFTAYRLRFGYGYATLIFPTWRRKQRQKQQTRSDGKENNDVDEIIDALLEINVSLHKSNDHHHDDNYGNTNSDQSKVSTSIRTTTPTTLAPSYLAAHETILDSIGAVAYSTTTFIEFHYHSMIQGASTTTQSTILLPSPVVKTRTDFCYCVEDENFPGTVGEYDLTTAGRSQYFCGKGGTRGGDGAGDENRGYSLPTMIVNSLPLEDCLGKSHGANCSSSSVTGVYASNCGGGLDRKSGGSSVIDHQTNNTSTNFLIDASSDQIITGVNDEGSDLLKDSQDSVDCDAFSQEGGDKPNVVRIENESVDTSATNTISKRNTAVITADDIGRNPLKRALKESATLAKNCTTVPLFNPPSPAKSSVVLDVEVSPYSEKRRKVDTNDMKENDSNPKRLFKEDTLNVATLSSGTERSSDKPGGGKSATTSQVPLVSKLAERDSKIPTANIQTTAQMIANELEGSLQEMEKLTMTKEFVDIHTTKQDNIFRKLDDAMTAAMRLTPPLGDSQSNQEPAAANMTSEKFQSEPSKKKSNIHTTSEKIARELANKVSGEQKKAFGVENRISCRARGLPADHSTAYIVIPKEINHGDALLCSHPACRVSKKFLYCQYCQCPIAKHNFVRHNRNCAELKKKSNDKEIRMVTLK